MGFLNLAHRAGRGGPVWKFQSIIHSPFPEILGTFYSSALPSNFQARSVFKPLINFGVLWLTNNLHR